MPKPPATGMTNRKHTVLVIEDDPDILELLCYHLERSGYEVATAPDGEQGLQKVYELMPSLVVLDLMLPGVDGLSVAQSIRRDERVAKIPVIMLTAKGEESDVIVGLELGADDYVSKPFSPKELVARIRANLRSRQRGSDEVEAGMLLRGPLKVNHQAREIVLRGQVMNLTHAEYKLLYTLLLRPGHVITRAQLIEVISGPDTFVIDRNVDVHVRAVRKKLGPDSGIITTVRGVGYKCKL